jgi:hypothetical protein
MRRVELARLALRDLRKITGGTNSAGEPRRQGFAGPLRLRVGDWRIVYRPLTRAELKRLGAVESEGYLVARIVNRRDLERTLRTLEL